MTRNGERVTLEHDIFPIEGKTFGGDTAFWTKEGRYYTNGEDQLDLFMAEDSDAIPAEPTGIEAELCRMFTERQAFGIKKYGVTVEDNPLSLREWLHNALMESMDHCVYLLRAIKEIDKNEGNDF